MLRLQMPKRSHRAGKLAHAHVFGRRVKPREVALHLRIPVQQLQPKGRRLRMNPVRPPNRRRVLELQSAPLEHRQQSTPAPRESVPMLLSLAAPAPYPQRHSKSVHNAASATRSPKPCALETFRHSRREGDHVVLHLGLDFLDARDGKAGLGRDRLRPPRRESRRPRPAQRSPPPPPGASSDICSLQSRCGPSPGVYSVRSSANSSAQAMLDATPCQLLIVRGKTAQECGIPNRLCNSS